VEASCHCDLLYIYAIQYFTAQANLQRSDHRKNHFAQSQPRRKQARTMLRRPVHPRPPSSFLLAVRALATVSPSLPSPANNGPESTIITVMNLRTRQPVTLDLDKIKPFTPEFAMLPARYRPYVERKHLRDTIIQRQKQEMEIVSKEDKREEQVLPNQKLVDKYLNELLRRRKAVTDKPPSAKVIEQYLVLATRKAVKQQKRKLTEKSQSSPSQSLSFEQQWHRRQRYGRMPPLC
jgi:hypothetical protein